MTDQGGGEREFRPRAPGMLFPWLKLVSWIELGLFAALLVVWLTPVLGDRTFYFGLAHGIGFIVLALMVWVAIMRREAPFWLLAATVTPLGPVGSTIGIEWIEHRHRRIHRTTAGEPAGPGDSWAEDSDPPQPKALPDQAASS